MPQKKKNSSSGQRINHADPLSSGPSSLMFQSFIKFFGFILIFVIVGFVLLQGGNSSNSLQSSLITNDGEKIPVTETEIVSNGDVNIKIAKFFPPTKIKFTDPTGVERSYPFFQRSRVLVPRFKFASRPGPGWKVNFVLDPESETDRRDSLYKGSLNDTIKTRFLHVKPGSHNLLVQILDKDSNVIKEIRKNNILILDKSIALIGDSIFSGNHVASFESTLDSPSLAINAAAAKFTFPRKFDDNVFGHGMEVFIEQAYQKKDQLVFPLNLSFSESPAVLSNRLAGDLKNYLLSLDGKMENESFLGIDEIWINFGIDSFLVNLSPEQYIKEIETIINVILEKGFTRSDIVIIPPTFSAEVNLKAYLKPLDEFIKTSGVTKGPDIYTLTRAEFGKYVSFDHEPALSVSGMEAVANALVNHEEK